MAPRLRIPRQDMFSKEQKERKSKVKKHFDMIVLEAWRPSID